MPSGRSSTSTGYSNFSDLALAHVVERQQQRDGGADERQHLHEAGEAVDDEGAVEQRLPARRLREHERMPPRPARRWRASRSRSASRSLSGRNTPSISSAMAPIARAISLRQKRGA